MTLPHKTPDKVSIPAGKVSHSVPEELELEKVLAVWGCIYRAISGSGAASPLLLLSMRTCL